MSALKPSQPTRVKPRRGRVAKTWPDVHDIAARLAIPGLTGPMIAALLDRASFFFPGAEKHEKRGWIVPSDVLNAFLTGDESTRALAILDHLRGLSFKTISWLLECDAKSVSRHEAWKAVAKDWPGIGYRVPVESFRKLGGLEPNER